MKFAYSMPTRIIAGEGCLVENAAEDATGIGQRPSFGDRPPFEQSVNSLEMAHQIARTVTESPVVLGHLTGQPLTIGGSRQVPL